MDVTNWEQGYFFQDDWKVKPKLTVNLGVRYEWFRLGLISMTFC